MRRFLFLLFFLVPNFCLANNHQQTQVQCEPLPFESFFGDIHNAMRYYGNFYRNTFTTTRASSLPFINAEQEKILEFMMSKENYKLPAWVWQHFVSSETKRKALALLDPESIDELDPKLEPELFGKLFTLKRLEECFNQDPKLAEAGRVWLASHTPTSMISLLLTTLNKINKMQMLLLSNFNWTPVVLN